MGKRGGIVEVIVTNDDAFCPERVKSKMLRVGRRLYTNVSFKRAEDELRSGGNVRKLQALWAR